MTAASFDGSASVSWTDDVTDAIRSNAPPPARAAAASPGRRTLIVVDLPGLRRTFLAGMVTTTGSNASSVPSADSYTVSVTVPLAVTFPRLRTVTGTVVSPN